MEERLTTFEAAQISGYELDYIRKLIRAEKTTGRKASTSTYSPAISSAVAADRG